MNSCAHDFHKVQVGEVCDGENKNCRHACIVVCAYCGQVRELFSDGKVVVVVPEGEVVRPRTVPADEAGRP